MESDVNVEDFRIYSLQPEYHCAVIFVRSVLPLGQHVPWFIILTRKMLQLHARPLQRTQVLDLDVNRIKLANLLILRSIMNQRVIHDKPSVFIIVIFFKIGPFWTHFQLFLPDYPFNHIFPLWFLGFLPQSSWLPSFLGPHLSQSHSNPFIQSLICIHKISIINEDRRSWKKGL